MAADPATTNRHAPSRKRKPKPSANGVFGSLGCIGVRYSFRFSREKFAVDRFVSETGIKDNQPWSAGVYPEEPATDYHVHFSGCLRKTSINIEIEYVNGRHKHPTKGPSAESIMKWLGGFLSQPTVSCFASAKFKKPTDSWRSRFNLPFKVTMGDKEVVINGLAMEFPRNDHLELQAAIRCGSREFQIALEFLWTVTFDSFELSRDVSKFDDALVLFMEPLK